MKYREIKSSELGFLKEMLYEAIIAPEGQQPFPRTILEKPEISKYYANWGNLPHDLAIVVESKMELVGAVWGRSFQLPTVGYGFIDESTPEISIAVSQSHRNMGIGALLIDKISDVYAQQNVKAISLSVQKNNRAFKLYQRVGFELISENEEDYIMRKAL